MIAISICKDKAEAEEYLKREISGGEFVLLAKEENKICGCGVISLQDERAVVSKVYMEEGELVLLMVQAVLNFAERRGIKEAICTDESAATILKKLGFCEQNGEYTVSLEGYFEPGAHCTHK